MSRLEVSSLLGTTLDMVDVIIDIYYTIYGVAGLHLSFHKVGRRLLLLRHTLIALQKGLEEGVDLEDSNTELKQTLEGCKGKIASLEQVFRVATVAPEALAAICALGKARQLEELMDSIINDMHLLAADPTISIITRSDAKAIIELMER